MDRKKNPKATHCARDITLSRRMFLGGLTATAGLAIMPRAAFAAGDPEARLVKIFLRGGMDGLAAIPPLGDANHARARGSMATPQSETLDLDGFFAIDQRLATIKALYDAGEAVIFHAINTPYEDRSHFEAMDTLEIGGRAPNDLSTGWLARASEAASAPLLAMGGATPLSTLGALDALAYSPSDLPPAPVRMLSALKGAYRNHPLLRQGLMNGRKVERIAQSALGSLPANELDEEVGPTAAFANIASAFLVDPRGPRLATLDIGGWDTHEGQTPLLRESLFPVLDQTVATLRAGLAAVWDKTTIMVVSEFGRQVQVNGSRGTDHGTGGVAMLLGGAVSGGRVIAEWPGLGPSDLHDGDALRPTRDLRGVMKAVVRDHLKVPTSEIDTTLFPHSEAAPLVPGLFR